MNPADAEDNASGAGGAVRRRLGDLGAFAMYSAHRFVADGCFAAAGALSYAMLVSLVPLGVIGLASLSVVPIFEPVREQLLAFIFHNLVPEIGEQASYWFRTFAESAGRTTAISFAGFIATGVLLLSTIEDQLNVIWRVTNSRPWVYRVLAYWTLMTLGPLLLGVSVSLSTYFEIVASQAGLAREAAAFAETGWAHRLALWLPVLFEFVAFTLLYCLIPNCAVRWRDGALGALIATIVIEMLKVGFSIYVRTVSFYETVYGTLAAIPIFLFWMYLSWMAVLLGAVVAAALPNWRVDERIGPIPAGGVQLGLSLALIAALARAQQQGRTLATPALAAVLGVATTVVDEHMKPLAAAGFVAHTQAGRWVLAWNPENATLRDLYEALRLPFAGRWVARPSVPWQRQVAPAMDRVVRAEGAVMEVTIAALLAEIAEAEPRRRGRFRARPETADEVVSD
jgi:membrane protein